MGSSKKPKLDVLGTTITVVARDTDNYISLTDIAKHKEPTRSDHVIQNWMRNRDTVEFLGVWERLHNPDFKPLEFEGFRAQAGTNAFVLTPRQWIEATDAMGIISKPGRYGGTYAHSDIAFEFATWISVEFKLYLIKEFQRLKEEENRRLALGWDLNRALAKINYRVHTDAIKSHLVPEAITAEQARNVYANEADLLNVALFGMTAKQWRDENPSKDGNIRDYASVEQLIVLSNLESLNAEYIRVGLSAGDRLQRLNETAIRHMRAMLSQASTIQKLQD